MQKIVGGKKYDSETAEKLLEVESAFGADITLYKTKNGNFFQGSRGLEW